MRRLLARVARSATPVYVVGGVVRDLVLGRPDDEMADVDLLVASDALGTARRAANGAGWAFYALDAARDVARLVYKETAADGTTVHLICDVSALNGRSLAADLADRDFTINAMAFVWHGVGRMAPLIDPHGGVSDLQAQRLRRVGEISLPADPLRLVRAVRLAAQFGLDMDAPLRTQIRQLAPRIHESSPERLRDELWKALATSDPAAVLDELHALTLLQEIVPEVARTTGIRHVPYNAPSAPPGAATAQEYRSDVYQHTLDRVSCAARWRDWLLQKSDAAHHGNGNGRTAHSLPANGAPGSETLLALRPQLVAHFAQQFTPERNRAQWLVWHALFHAVGIQADEQHEVVHDVGASHADSEPAMQTASPIDEQEHATASVHLLPQRLRALRFSRDEIALAGTVVGEQVCLWKLHRRFRTAALDRRTCYRFFRATGGRRGERPPGVDIVLLALAGLGAGDVDHSLRADRREFMAHARQLLDYAFAPDGLRAVLQRPLVNGHLLMTRLEIEAGPQLGHLLEYLAEAQAAGDIQTTEEAIQHAAQWLTAQNS